MLDCLAVDACCLARFPLCFAPSCILFSLHGER